MVIYGSGEIEHIEPFSLAGASYGQQKHQCELADAGGESPYHNKTGFSDCALSLAVLSSGFVLLYLSCLWYINRYRHADYLDWRSYHALDGDRLAVSGGIRAEDGDELAACRYPAYVISTPDTDDLVAKVPREPD